MAMSATGYDPAGRSYTQSAFAIDDQTGSVLAERITRRWHDRMGRVVKVAGPDGLLTKTRYNGAGWQLASFQGVDQGESPTDFAAALDLSGDTIVSQERTLYDPAGRALATASYQRTEGATATGALT
ncbi:MAG: hypothetical protein ACOCYP_02085, partial [Planctomycetota bacterium]